MKYVTFGQDGKLNGRYDSEIHLVIPDGAVEVSEELFLETIESTQGYWERLEDVVMHTIPPAPIPTPAELIAAAHGRINAAYTAAVNALTAGYPETEIASWPKQEAEARAYLLDANAPTPWIDAAAIARGITRGELAALIIANADAFGPAHAALTGKRQALRDEIDALGETPTAGQLDAIQWQ